MLFLAISGMAWAFDVRKKRNKFGNEVDIPWLKYTSLLIAKPDPFEFEMTAASDEKRRIIEDEGKMAELDQADKGLETGSRD